MMLIRRHSPEYKKTRPISSQRPKADELYKLPYKEMVTSLLDVLASSGEGYSLKALQTRTNEFIDDGVVEKFNLPYSSAAYKPVVQMIDYLTAKGYKVFACTGSPTQVVQTFSQQVFHIPPERVIGTRIKTMWDEEKGMLMVEKGLFPPVNDGKGKPVNIANYMQLQPIIAFGNSDGDMAMFDYAQSSNGPSLAVLIHHDDELRDFSYTNFTENALKAASAKSWVVVRSANDFKQVFMVPDAKLSH